MHQVWLPDVRWGLVGTPPCPQCGSDHRVKVHCCPAENGGCRRVVGLDNTYYILTRRYICSSCQDVSDHARKQIKTTAAQDGLLIQCPVTSKTDVPSYTFLSWNRRSLDLSPHGYGELFPDVTTYRGALDTKVVDMMRVLFNTGVPPPIETWVSKTRSC